MPFAACFVPTEDPEPAMTECFPPDDSEQTLLFFNGRKWEEIGKVPSTADSLAFWIDRQGEPKFTFVRRDNYIYEEAEAGVVCVGLRKKTGVCWTEVSDTPGRVESLQFNLDGESIIFAANFSENRVITTHLKLWILKWEGLCVTQDPVLLSDDILIVPDMVCEMTRNDTVFFNTVEVDTFKSYIVEFSEKDSSGAVVPSKPKALPSAAMCAPILDENGTVLFYPSESLTSYVDIRNPNGDVF